MDNDDKYSLELAKLIVDGYFWNNWFAVQRFVNLIDCDEETPKMALAIVKKDLSWETTNQG